MSLISKLTPINLIEEKQKFFDDQSYNPQFIYEENILPKDLVRYGIPDQKYFEIAQIILDRAFYNKTEQELFEEEGNTLTQGEVTQKIEKFLQMHNLEDKYHIVWSASFVSRASITSDTIKLRLPVDFHIEGLLGMIYHEIGTHALRRVNYELQPWFKKKKQYGFSEYLFTEEGLASLHSLLPHTNKLAHNSALRFLAVQKAQTGSFAELWQFLSKYIDNWERRWIIAVRQKKGLQDTSQPGGFTKDLVYFEGMIEVWSWMKKNNFDPTILYLGKLAKEDVDKAKKLNPNFMPLLPSFFTANKDFYYQEIEKIGIINEWEKI